MRATITDGTNYEIVLVTANDGAGNVTIQRAVEPTNRGVQTAFGFASGSTITPTNTAAGHYPGASPSEPVWLAPVQWCYVNLPVAGFTIDPYTYNSLGGPGDTVTQDTPSDGALTINGGTPNIGDRVAFCDLTYPGYNYCGVYTVTALGDGVSIPWVLTRAIDNDTAATLGTYWAVSVQGDPSFSQANIGPGLVNVSWVPPSDFVVGSSPVDLNVMDGNSQASGTAFATGGSFARGFGQIASDASVAIRGLANPAAEVESVVAGTNISVDSTDPANPVVSSTQVGGGIVNSVVAGTDISVDDTDPTNPIVSYDGPAQVGNSFLSLVWTEGITYPDGGVTEVPTPNESPGWTQSYLAGSDLSVNADGSTIEVATEGTYLIRGTLQWTPDAATTQCTMTLGTVTGLIAGDYTGVTQAVTPGVFVQHQEFSWNLRIDAGGHFNIYVGASGGADNVNQGVAIDIVRIA